MRRKKLTKARRLLSVAYATYRSGDKKIAADIFELAMEDPSAPSEFGGGPSMDDLKASLNEAISNNDFGAASEFMAQIKAMGDEGDEGGEMPMDLGDEGEEEDELGEGALSPGDEVPPPPPVDLAPAQVASLVTLARKVKAGGHADLAKRITKALGL